MSKTWLVLKNEFLTTVTRRSFIVTLLILPVISGILMLVLNRYGDKASEIVTQVFGSPETQLVEGYVDQSGLISGLPDSVPPGRFIRYEGENQARAALVAGEVTGFYLVPPDFMESGEVKYIRDDFNPLSGMDESSFFNYVINYNLVGQDAWMAERMNSALVLEKQSISAEPVRDANNPLTFFLPYAVTMLFYITILTSSSFMLNSITLEKQNRVMEILMSSITPWQMLVGKIIALGLVGLVQTMVWAGAGFAFLRTSGAALNIPAAFQLPISFLLWSVVFFLLGYFLYASLLAGVGALVPNLREASQATTVAIIPLVVPIMLLTPIVESPNGGIAVALSLIPFTSPVTMMTRLSAGVVPIWQILLSLVLLLLTSLLAIRAVSGMFRAQTLLSGKSFSVKTYARALVGKN